MVSYVVPFYKGVRRLAEALESISAQSYPEIETVVVDDGLREDCSPITDAFGPRVRVIRTPNHGVSGARNVGLTTSYGTFITFLDHDDLVYPRYAELLSAPMRADFRVDGAFCDAMSIGEAQPPEEERLDRYASPQALFKRRMSLSMGAGVFRKMSLDGLGGFDGLSFYYTGLGWNNYPNGPSGALEVDGTATPEPFTMALCAGGLGLAFAPRRKARRG